LVQNGGSHFTFKASKTKQNLEKTAQSKENQFKKNNVIIIVNKKYLYFLFGISLTLIKIKYKNVCYRKY
jgi:Fe-S cluster assembly iron-binding protein IscA